MTVLCEVNASAGTKKALRVLFFFALFCVLVSLCFSDVGNVATSLALAFFLKATLPRVAFLEPIPSGRQPYSLLKLCASLWNRRLLFFVDAVGHDQDHKAAPPPSHALEGHPRQFSIKPVDLAVR